MPRWVVTCPECDHTFTHTAIEPAAIEQSYRDPFHVLPRPTIPKGGDKRTCPNCKKESLYEQVFYREDARGQAS